MSNDHSLSKLPITVCAARGSSKKLAYFLHLSSRLRYGNTRKSIWARSMFHNFEAKQIYLKLCTSSSMRRCSKTISRLMFGRLRFITLTRSRRRTCKKYGTPRLPNNVYSLFVRFKGQCVMYTFNVFLGCNYPLCTHCN